MSSDSSLSSPMDSTFDIPDASSSPSAALKKARRQTAFYPNMNASNKPQKPFSRSAAKRESVMALGSIEHLQHYFTKTGLSAKQNPLKKPYSGLVPALGPGLAHLLTGVSEHPEIELPPSPAVPVNSRPAYPPVIKDYQTDPETLRPGVIHDLEAVSSAWELPGSDDAQEHAQDTSLLGVDQGKGRGHSPDHVDVLSLLKTTTRAIRSVRNYLLSLPDDSTSLHPNGRPFRPHSLSPAPAAQRRRVSQPDAASDPLSLIRRSALDVLTVLRALEETSRVPLSDDAYDTQSDHGSGPSRVASPGSISNEDDADPDASFAISVLQVQGKSGGVPVWDDEDEADQQEEEEEKREGWDERLVLGSGWLYKQDVRPEDLGTEREVVGRYLDVVDVVLFGGARDDKRGWLREKEKFEKETRGKIRRASSGDSDGHGFGSLGRSTRRGASSAMLDALRGMTVSEEPEEMEAASETESVEDDDLPDWAKRIAFMDDPLGRTFALLINFLPAALLPLLPAPASNSRETLLQSLTSGQLLCIAYNTGVRRSRKPWGYISKDAIHDVAALEAQSVNNEDGAGEKGKTAWTFRRTDNLRLWAAALKLRYLLSIATPSQGNAGTPTGTPVTSPAPSTVKFPGSEPPTFFDARVIARREEGWADMLESVVLKWMWAVVDEKRGER